jgi:hypothetical protein
MTSNKECAPAPSKPARDSGIMSEQMFTMLQICIICFLVFMLGAVVLLQHTEWFNGKGHDYRAVTLRHWSDDSATRSATNIETTTTAAATADALRRQP